jgi:hypothetical protein
MSTGAKALLGLFAFCLLTIGVQTWRLVGAQRRVQALELAPAKAATVTAKAETERAAMKVAAAAQQVAAGVRVVYRTIHDTVPVPMAALHPVTAADTQSAVAALPVVKAERDAIAGKCSAFVVTCEEYRRTAEERFAADDHRFAADSVYRVGLEAALRGAAPSRLGAVWNKVKLPLAFAGGFYLALQVK